LVLSSEANAWVEIKIWKSVREQLTFMGTTGKRREKLETLGAVSLTPTSPSPRMGKLRPRVGKALVDSYRSWIVHMLLLN
jgi:hypothetical protein